MPVGALFITLGGIAVGLIVALYRKARRRDGSSDATE